MILVGAVSMGLASMAMTQSTDTKPAGDLSMISILDGVVGNGGLFGRVNDSWGIDAARTHFSADLTRLQVDF